MNNTDELEHDPDLHRLFVASMADEPPAPAVEDQLLLSRRGLKRRQGGIALMVAAVVAALMVVPAVIARDDGSDNSLVDRPDLLMPEAMISTCRDGNQSDRATDALFGSGQPELRMYGTEAEMMSVVLISADGNYWADCFINLYDGAEFSSGMTVYPDTGERRASGHGFSNGFTCKALQSLPGPRCETFFVDYVDRVAEQVDAVSFLTADGTTTTVEAIDGFILFGYTGEVPAGYPRRETMTGRHPQWLIRVTYLDENGEPIAAQNMGQSRPDLMTVEEDLPVLSKYKSRRSSPIW